MRLLFAVLLALCLMPLMSPAVEPKFKIALPPDAGYRIVLITGAINDVNGDDVMELLVQTMDTSITICSGADGSVVKLLPLPKGPITTPVQCTVALDDLTGDGRQEILVGVGNQFTEDLPPYSGQVYLFDGDLNHTAPLEVLSSPQPVQMGLFGSNLVALPDIDGDDVGDFAASSDFGSVTDLYSGATRTHLRRVAIPGYLYRGQRKDCAQDLTGDGVPDLLLSQRYIGGDFLVQSPLINGATGEVVRTYSWASAPQAYYGFYSLFVPDVTGDNVPEVAMYVARRAAVLLDGESGAVVRTLGEEAGNLGSMALVGDVNGDGRRDLAFGANPELGGRVLFIDPATGNRFATLLPPADSVPQEQFVYVTALPDLEGDGKANFALGSGNTYPNRIYVYNGLEPALAAGEVWVMW